MGSLVVPEMLIQIPSNATERRALCQKEYVEEKDCDAWVADQLARKAARARDEQKRRQSQNRTREDGAIAGTSLVVPEMLIQIPSNATERRALCQKEYVEEKYCDAWVADQLARKAARARDE